MHGTTHGAATFGHRPLQVSFEPEEKMELPRLEALLPVKVMLLPGLKISHDAVERCMPPPLSPVWWQSQHSGCHGKPTCGVVCEVAIPPPIAVVATCRVLNSHAAS